MQLPGKGRRPSSIPSLRWGQGSGKELSEKFHGEMDWPKARV